MNLFEILEEAIKAEQEAQRRYRRGAEEAADPETRALFKQLMREEESHEVRLRERLLAVKLIKGD